MTVSLDKFFASSNQYSIRKEVNNKDIDIDVDVVVPLQQLEDFVLQEQQQQQHQERSHSTTSSSSRGGGDERPMQPRRSRSSKMLKARGHTSEPELDHQKSKPLPMIVPPRKEFSRLHSDNFLYCSDLAHVRENSKRGLTYVSRQKSIPNLQLDDCIDQDEEDDYFDDEDDTIVTFDVSIDETFTCDDDEEVQDEEEEEEVPTRPSTSRVPAPTTRRVIRHESKVPQRPSYHDRWHAAFAVGASSSNTNTTTAGSSSGSRGRSLSRSSLHRRRGPPRRAQRHHSTSRTRRRGERSTTIQSSSSKTSPHQASCCGGSSSDVQSVTSTTTRSSSSSLTMMEPTSIMVSSSSGGTSSTTSPLVMETFKVGGILSIAETTEEEESSSSDSDDSSPERRHPPSRRRSGIFVGEPLVELTRRAIPDSFNVVRKIMPKQHSSCSYPPPSVPQPTIQDTLHRRTIKVSPHSSSSRRLGGRRSNSDSPQRRMSYPTAKGKKPLPFSTEENEEVVVGDAEEEEGPLNLVRIGSARPWRVQRRSSCVAEPTTTTSSSRANSRRVLPPRNLSEGGEQSSSQQQHNKRTTGTTRRSRWDFSGRMGRFHQHQP